MWCYTGDHLHLINLAFGRRGIDLAVRTPVAYADDGKDRVDFDRVEGSDAVRHTLSGFAEPFVVLHEFAHIYHVVNWRALSYEAPVLRCEAAACLAEAYVANRHSALLPELRARIEIWAPGVRTLLNELASRGELDWHRELHDQMFMVLSGGYVDRHPDLL